LRAVNHRRFAARLSAGIPGACFADDASTALAHIESRTPPAGWLLKRPFGFSGRARKRLRSPLTAAERRWITASMAGFGGGLQIEPFVQVCAEYALHGFIEPSGPTLRGAVIGQECAADGAWLRHGAAAADPAHINALHRSFEVVVTALREVGYFGPFCIDALVYRDGEGRVQLQPLGEINARFTMGYFTGMASQLPALTAALRRLAAAPPPRDQGR
jgi:hypothetical protein